jgi:hypothetical protein
VPAQVAACWGATVVRNFELERLLPVANYHVRLRRSGVLARVRERLLHDPVAGEVDSPRKRSRLVLDRKLDGQPSRAHVREERLELGEAGLGRELRLGLSPAEDPEEAAHLGERLPPRLLDREERAHGAPGRLGEQQTGRARLHDHDADRVRDDVVQVARDPAPLGGDRGALPLLALALEAGRPPLELGGAAAAPPQDKRGEPDAGPDQEVAAGVGPSDAGVARDDDDDGGKAGRQTRHRLARLRVRADAPEGKEQGGEERGGARRRLGVDEGHGGKRGEDARGRGEGEAAPKEKRQRREQHARDDGELRSGDRHRPDLDLDDDRDHEHGQVE